jgi:hypothetical protein
MKTLALRPELVLSNVEGRLGGEISESSSLQSNSCTNGYNTAAATRKPEEPIKGVRRENVKKGEKNEMDIDVDLS